MTQPSYQIASDMMHAWRDDVMSDQPPVLYPIGTGGLSRFEIGPGLVTLIGGAPCAGKTAFAMQAGIEALRFTPDLNVLVCNIEMPPKVLLDRQLARLSGIDLTTIRYRRLGPEHTERIERGMATLENLTDRLAFLQHPFDLGNVAATADDFDADLIILDYIQRIHPPGEHDNRRSSVDACMSHLRNFASAGQAVMVVSAVSRTKDDHGRSSYAGEGLNLASFRESSELEFGADDAFILHTLNGDPGSDQVVLKHLKSRHGECRDMHLQFDRKRQNFTMLEGTSTPPVDGTPDAVALSELWNRTPVAAETGRTDHE